MARLFLPLFLLIPAMAVAQQPGAADRYDPIFDQLRNIAPRRDRSAAVHDLVLRRDAIEFHLDQGGISLLTPVGGRTVGAVFVGAGSVSFAPPWDIERARLQHVLGDTVLNARVSAVAFIVADSTPLGGLNPEEDVGADVANSLAFFSRAFGPPLAQQFYATEIPYFYGQAFPGLIYLSFGTFQTINESGSEETFRSHEMAHQWWGIGVDAATYRDAWLSEGFAEFSGLWYTQVFLKDNEKFFKQLEDRKRDIRGRRGDIAPIGLGTRLLGTDHPEDYSLMVYAKGAWVLQMLRNMMIDFGTMKEDAFSAMMRDFYQQYRGRRASTHDFQRVVEQHVDLPMDWFFNEWVNGTAIPTYILSWHAERTSDDKHLLHVRVRQEDVPSDFVMPVPLEIDFKSGGHATVRVTVRGPVTDAQIQVPSEPARLVLNPVESVLAEVKEEGWH
jgi:peptidase M1-like protein